MSDKLEQFEGSSPEAKATSSSLTEQVYNEMRELSSKALSIFEKGTNNESVKEALAPLELYDSTSKPADAKPAESKPADSKSEGSEPKAENKPEAPSDSNSAKNVLSFAPEQTTTSLTSDNQTSDAPASKSLESKPENEGSRGGERNEGDAKKEGDTKKEGDGAPTRTGSGEKPLPVVAPNEMGEVIHRDVPPAISSGGKGDSLEKVAKDHLGPGATDEEVKAHVKEIARINGIKDVNKPIDGSPMVLPGHTKDGGFVTEDAQGNKRTIWHDGVVRIENTDGSGYVRKPGADGSYSEHHWGKNPQDNYELRKTADGKYEVADAGKDNFKPVADGDPRGEMAKLKDLADQKIKDPAERAQFEADMNKFASRQQELKERFEKQGMSPEEASKRAADEVGKTYKQVEKLLTAPDNPKLPHIKEKDRIQLAEQVMHQAATPTDVSQGSYNTCNVTVIESQSYSKNPSEAARLVTDIVTEGKYTSNGNPPTTVEVGKDINPDSLKRHGDSNNPYVPGENNRSFASQIYEVTAVNVHYAKENAKTNPPGQIRYEQRDPGPDSGPNGDNGERLYDYSKKDPKTGKVPAEVMLDKEPVRSPDLTPQEIANLSRDLNAPDKGDGPVRIDIDPVAAQNQKIHETENKILALQMQSKGLGDGQPINLDDPAAVKSAREKIDGSSLDQAEKDKMKAQLDKLEKEHAFISKDGIAYVKDEKQLNEALAKLKAEGRLPIIVGVHTGTEPFSTDANEAGARGGRHVVTITDYNPGPPATVSIDNQWDKSADHGKLETSQLFKSMQHRDSGHRIAELQKQVDDNRRNGKIDYTKETELLFEKHGAGKINDQELIDGISKTFEDVMKAKKEGKITDEQFQNMMERMRELRSQLPKEQQDALNNRLKVIKEANK